MAEIAADPDPPTLTARAFTPGAAWSLLGDPAARAFRDEVRNLFGFENLPTRHRMLSGAAGWQLLWTGPDSALAMAEPGTSLPGIEDARSRLMACGGALVDTTHARVAVALSGRGAAQRLSAGCPMDFDPAVFPPGSVRSTLLGPLPCIVVHSTAAGTYWLLVGRSYSTSLWHWLDDLPLAGGPAEVAGGSAP